MKKLLWIWVIAITFIACQNGQETTQDETRETTTEQLAAAEDVESTVTDIMESEEGEASDEAAEEAMKEEETAEDEAEEEKIEKAKTEEKEPKKTAIKQKESTSTKSALVSKPKESKPTTTKTATTTKKVEKPVSEPTKPTTTATKPTVKKEKTPVKAEKPALSHTIWDGLLRKYVSSAGNVNYSGFVKDKAKLKAYTDLLAANPPQSSWSKGKTMAYWINAYNAFTVQKIVNNYPIKSILNLDGGNTWKKFDVKIGGKSYSLDQIEKQLLIKKYNEPRIHFAVNCAAKSCPALLNRAWTSGNLESNFEKQSKNFVNNTQFNKLSKKSLELSQIFEWYAGDFGDVKAFVKKYANTEISDKAKISYIPYNWDLNK